MYEIDQKLILDGQELGFLFVGSTLGFFVGLAIGIAIAVVAMKD